MPRGYQHSVKTKEQPEPTTQSRIVFLLVLFVMLGLAIITRFFYLQVLEYKTYQLLASDQHEIERSLTPVRGTIYIKDQADELHPIAKDRPSWNVFASPREMTDASSTAVAISQLLNLDVNDVAQKFAATSSAYALLAKDVPYDQVEALRNMKLKGIGITKSSARWYPETGFGGHVLGFVQLNDQNVRVGQYGLEGYFNEELAGTPGKLITEKDAAGGRITVGDMELTEAKNGSDLVLTLDRTIQYQACIEAKQAVQTYTAERSTIIVMDPYSGAIVAMCSYPDFSPAEYNKVSDIGVYNNPATFYQYEPGSIFKPLTMAAGINAGKILPTTTYNDTGEEKIDNFTIHNSDKLAHGIRTMNEVLEQSLNTGTIFVERQLGKDLFTDYVRKWGFGIKTGIELNSETKGDTSSLDKKGAIFAATASFGQGIAVSPLQITSAFASLANGGKLMKPYIVQQVINPDGSKVDTKPEMLREVVTPRAARLTTGMMVNVVENGHGKKAAVPGYYVAGKTGTAQIPDPRGGYLQNVSIGSFAGYAPAEHPKFVMLVKVDKPKDLQYAEVSAAPVWGDMAKFLLKYYEVPPERPIVEKKVEELPPLPDGSSATGTATTSTIF